MEHGELLKNITFLMDNCSNDYYNKEDLTSLLFDCLNELLESVQEFKNTIFCHQC